MELYQLRTFVTVARLEHVTRAATALHLTQPTVSGHIKALEGELGVALFVRSAGGVELTAFGRQVLEKAHCILALSDELAADARLHVGKICGQVTLAVINDPETYGLGTIMNAMREQYPNVTVEIRHGLSGWALDEVKSARRDAGFYIGRINDPDLRVIPVREVRYCIVGPIGWRDEVESDKWAAIGRLPWIWVPPIGSYPHLVTELLARHGVTPNRVIETDREAIIQNLVSAGVGLCLLREERARAALESGKVFVWEEGRIAAPLSFMFLVSRARDPLIQALGEVVERCSSMF